MEKSSIIVRNFVDTDRPFIFGTWLRGAYYGNPHDAKTVPTAVFDRQAQLIEKIITQPGSVVRIACLSDEPDTIIGYSVHNGQSLHWVCVKMPWRGRGVARLLLGAYMPGFKTYSGVTKVGLALAKKYNLTSSPVPSNI